MSSLSAPLAAIRPHSITRHGDARQDDYYWLRQREEPEVIAYLEAENAYTAALLEPSEQLRETIYQEILRRTKQTDLSVPVERGGFFYYARTEEGKQYPIFCRKQGSLEAPEETMLDANALAEGHAYFSLGALTVSEDHRLLGYSEDHDGSEEYTIRVKNLVTGEMLPVEIPRTSPGFTWANDNRTFFYTRFDATKRPEKVYRHVIGSTAADEVVYHEPDPVFHFDVGKSRSRRYLVITSVNSGTTSEVSLLSADDPMGQFQLVEPRRAGVEYYLAHHAGDGSDQFLIRTNDGGAETFRVMSAPTATPGRAHWTELIAADPARTIDDVACFRGHWVYSIRQDGLPHLEVYEVASGETHRVSFDDPAYDAYLGDNPEYETGIIRFLYTSLVTPAAVFDYDMKQRTRVLKKQTEVVGGYDSTEYVAERLQATASDGTLIPISLAYRKGMAKDGSNPLLLRGYGAYGINSDPSFSISNLSLMDRGFAIAIAHVRGGSECGRQWFEAGRKLQKRNSFTDFIACAEHLIAAGYTSPAHLAASGGSAGGLLMGAVINLRPDLFRSVIAAVPFVDVVTTMLDPSIPLTTAEYDQWGNPDEHEFYHYMKSYSPYDNVQPVAYPHLLITTGLNDPRVAYWEPAKWVAKLRSVRKGDRLLLLKTEMGAGHGGPSGRYERMKETALFHAFLVYSLSLPE